MSRAHPKRDACAFTRSLRIIEVLEPRMLLAADLKFAVIGDYSSDVQTQPETDVSTLVHGWNPSFIATTGDNNYPNGAAATIDANIGQYYHDYIYPYKGTYGAGSPTGTNRFWPTLGNHDWDPGTAQPYLNYFTLPGNGRYYTETQGNVELFMVDADPHEPDGNTAASVQGQWIKSQIAASTATWKLVLFHQPAYSSGDNGDSLWMQWPFAQWGASAVINGHDHDYERLSENGIPYFVDGLGGESIFDFPGVEPGSQVRYIGDYGAMLLDATATTLNFQFITRTGAIIDSYTLGAPVAPAAPSNLAATPVSSSQINLAWTNNATNTTASFNVERSTDGTNFVPIATTAANATTYSDTGLAASTTYTYRIRATNSAGQSPYAPVAAATTLAVAPITYLSDLPWVSATTGYGTIGKDVTVKGNPIKLRGVQFTKGIGTHAVSQIVYNLAGQFSNFICDVGVDDEVTSSGSIDFKVTGDGRVLFDSGVITSASPTISLNVPVTGVAQLTLLASNGIAGTIDFDHADWAGARLTSVPTVPTAPMPPTGLSASAPTPSQVVLSWTDNAPGNETGFIVQRGTDGINFTQIGTTATGVTTDTDTANLSIGTTYTYRVFATNAVGNSGYSNLASVTIPAAAPTTNYLSDLAWVSATAGWGAVTKDKTVAGNTITLRGTTYAKGLGTHAVSQIVYNLNGQYTSFQSDVGVDDEENTKGTGSVDFQVIGDGAVLFDSGVLTKANPIVHINVSVVGVKQLALLATNGVTGSIDYDHADWAGARVISVPAPTVPVAPVGLVATFSSPTLATLSWTDKAAGNETGFIIQRSTDGINFTQIGTTPTGVVTYSDISHLSAGMTYTYRVAATNAVGNSLFSNLAAVAVPSTITAGSLSYLTITLKDLLGNVPQNYTGTVHFTSSDPLAVLPADYTFTAGENATHQFAVTFKTAGSQTLTATDTVNAGLSGSQTGLTVVAGAATGFTFGAAPATTPAGAPLGITLTARDAFGNIAPGYTGTVHLSSSDAQAVLPANYAFTAADNGAHTFAVTLKTTGGQTLAASDTVSAGITGSLAGISVTAAAAASLTFGVLPATVSAGTAGNFTVTARDAYGNIASSYIGTIHLTGSDLQAVLGPDYTFTAADNGIHVFPATFLTAGNQSLAASDTINAALTATRSVAVTAATAASLTLTGVPATTTAGAGSIITVTLRDTYGNLATGYTGAVHFTSSDARATLPANYVFTAADNGAHIFAVTFKTAGIQTLTATDTVNPALTAVQGGIVVNPAAVAGFTFTGAPATSPAGASANFTMNARDAYGNPVTGYIGTVHFTSSDAQAVLPADYTFLAADNGSHGFAATLKTAGSQTVTATDTLNSAIAGSQPGISVTAGAASSLAFNALSAVAVAGTPGNFTLTARDIYGNVAGGYTGIVHLTSTDAQALLPPDYTFTAADNGIHVFAATFMTVASQSLTATDTINAALTATQPIAVTAAAAASLSLTGVPATTTAGVGSTITVTLRDTYGNLATGYTRTIRFASSDAAAALPANYVFTAADNGAHTFAVTFKSAGIQTLTATDSVNPALTAVQGGIVVTPAAVAGFAFTGAPATSPAGAAANFTVNARDAYGNLVTGYIGTVHFASSDAQAVLPADYTFIAADSGSHGFAAILKTAGSQTLTATDTLNSAIAGSQPGILVTAGAASSLAFGALPATAVAGTPGNYTLTARDIYGNIAVGYTGTVHLTSTDAQAVLPQDYTFTAADNGTHGFALTLKTAGNQSITATDTVNAGMSAAMPAVTVTSAAPASFTWIGVPATTTAGAIVNFTLTVRDAYGNIATGYAGTVHLASSDAQAALPADYTFIAADNGIHSLAVTFKTAGSQTLTATDTLFPSIAGSHPGIAVAAGAASSLAFGALPATVGAGAPFNFTLTARDIYGNIAMGYTGVVHLTSSDAQAVLAPDYTFTTADNGAHVFAVTLKTAGSQSITATDTANAGLSAVKPAITVTVAAAASFTWTGVTATTTAGAIINLTLTVRDAYGNIATGYTGTVHFASSDGQAVLPANYTFTAANAGVANFAVTLKTAGPQALSAADTANAALALSKTGIAVSAATASKFSLSGWPTRTTAGTAIAYTLIALDAYGNVATGYAGAVHFASSDAAAGLPADYTFTAADAGAHLFSTTLKTAASQTLSATDLANPALKIASAAITVVAGAAVRALVTAPASVTARSAFSFTVKMLDAYGNTATGYTGTVHVTSTDGAASLPANYRFTAAAAGIHTFNITMKTRGSQTITVADTISSTSRGTSNVILVK